MQLFSADATIFKKKQAQKLLIIHNWIFSPYCPELPIRLKN